MTSDRRVRALAVALAGLLCVAVLAQLLDGAQRQSGSADADPLAFVVEADAGPVCQTETASFAGTGSYRATIATPGEPGPPLRLEVRDADGQAIASGRLDAGFKPGVVDIPLDDVTTRDVPDATVCFTWDAPAHLAFGGEAPDRISLIQFRPGQPSLLASLDDAARHYGRGNASWLGGWSLVVVVLLVLAAIALGATAFFKPDWWRPVGAFLLIGAAWAILTPPFHVPDEMAHYAYVARIVEAADLPGAGTTDEFSKQEQNVLAALGFYTTIGSRTAKPPWSAAQERALRAAERLPGSRTPKLAGSAGANPPLYYVLQSPVYAATRWTNVLGQLLPMRLLSVLFGGLTVLFCWLFLRELLPRSPWAWPAGVLAVAFQPLFGFVGSGVNADALLFAASAATFWLMAAILRRGPTPRLAIGLGAALAVGALTKPLFLGLVPAALLALLVAGLRARQAGGLRLLALAAGVALLPVLAYVVIGAVAFDHPYFGQGASVGGLSGDAAQGTAGASRREELSYVWQLWAPRLPFMDDLFTGQLPLRSVWFDGFVGRFGWLDYDFASWVTMIAKWIAIALLLAAAVAVARTRRWVELLVLGAGAAGLILVIGVQQYNVYSTGAAGAYTQARYLLPLLALYGGVIAAAVHTGGRRWGVAAGVVFAGVAALHSVSAMLLTVSRYYL